MTTKMSNPSAAQRPAWCDESALAALASQARASRPGATVNSPMTGDRLVDLPHSSAADIDDAFRLARLAQIEWASRPAEQRADILLRFHDLCLKHQSRILDVVQLETGKARRHAFEEIADCAISARYLGRTAPEILETDKAAGVFPVLSQTRINHHPKGVVGIVSPWNYPFALAIGDSLPALAAGNGVVLRPDDQGALSALLGRELLIEAGLPPEILQIVLGGADAGQAVVERGDAVSFTGSTATGRAVAETAGRRLVACSLELGGKNGMYVRADADLSRAVEGIIRACYSSAGQLCVSIERLYVHRDIAPRLQRALVDAIGAMRLGNALAYGYDMGSLCGPRQIDRVVEHVEDAVAHGATVLAGGRRRPDLGPYVYEPTLLSGVTSDMALYRQETFGPVVAWYEVGSDDEAVEAMNDSEYGLNASIYTRDVRTARHLAARIRTGLVNINEGYAPGYAAGAAPMGGMKASGLGRRHGAEGLLKYTDYQSVTAQHVIGFGPIAGLNDGQYAAVLSTALKALKKLGAH